MWSIWWRRWKPQWREDSFWGLWEFALFLFWTESPLHCSLGVHSSSFFQKWEMQCQLHDRFCLQPVLRGGKGCVRLQEECTWTYAAGMPLDADLLFVLYRFNIFYPIQFHKYNKTNSSLLGWNTKPLWQEFWHQDGGQVCPMADWQAEGVLQTWWGQRPKCCIELWPDGFLFSLC